MLACLRGSRLESSTELNLTQDCFAGVQIEEPQAQDFMRF